MESYPNLFLLDMTFVPRLGSLSAPPRPAPQLLLAISGPPPEAFFEVPLPHLQPQPQAVVGKETAQEDPNETFEYFIEGDDAPEVASNAIVVVDAATQ